MKYVTISLLVAGLAIGQSAVAAEKLSVKFEKFTLPNGLDVIFHQDQSDPVVAVAIQYHVGSNREKPGKTGFAHLFEHMMFQESENVPQDQFFSKIQNAGGTLNGGTNKDGTVYYEVVPKNALEMVLWMESDRMGYLINTVTPSAFVNQQNVVQNEKRQNYDNRPYGHSGYVLDKNFYPAGHPYSWQTIGEMADLTRATIEDVKEFHGRYYVPNNATLVIAGDFDASEAKKLVEKYFGEIPGGKKVTDLAPMPVTLKETKKLYHEDNLATSAQLTMAWPTPHQYTPDSYALSFLSQILSDGKKAPMYRVLVKDKQLTSQARVYNMSQELSGRFQVSVNASAGVSLADVEKAVFEAFELFEKEGITSNDLERIKAGMETSFYNGMGSVLNKSFTLARYNEYAGDPGFVTKDLENMQAVTIADIKRVYEKYVKGKPYVATSFVPKGATALIAANSIKADIVEEKISEAVEVKLPAGAVEEPVIKTPSKFDRSKEPALGPDPAVKTPDVWESSYSNGIKVYGITNRELPLIQFTLSVYGGHLLDPKGKEGLASLVAGMMTEGTKNRTPEELEETIDLLGSRISISGGTEKITVSATTLARNFDKTMALVEEMLLEPRWDEEQFNILKRRVINGLRREAADPASMAGSAFRKLVYGNDHLLSTDVNGTIESVNSITLDDLKKYYTSSFTPSLAQIKIVGDVDDKGVKNAAESLISRWKPVDVKIPQVATPALPEKSRVYILDIPGAKQSVIQIGAPSLSQVSPDFFPATVVNYKLGGSFNGNLNLILREEKGFTYGARSLFTGGRNFGWFVASASVRSSATLESMQIFMEEMQKYTRNLSESDLQFTKNSLIRSNARDFETADAKLSMLEGIGFYNKPIDYLPKEQEFIKSLTPEKHVQLARKFIQPDKMYYLVAGDAETQMPELEKLGLGKPVLLNPKVK